MKKILIFFFMTISLSAQDSFTYNGYLKYLFSYAIPEESGNDIRDQLLHFRLNNKWYASDNLTAALEFRFRAAHGESFTAIPLFREQFTSDYEFLNLDWVVWENDNSIGYLQVDRLWFNYVYDDMEATIGRQRIAWGTTFVWNVIDLFNPLDILEFDYEERPGTGAVRLQYFTGPVTKLDVVAKPAETSDEVIYAGMGSVNFNDYDLFAMTGYRKLGWVFGGAWAGDIYGAGFRGEFTVSEAIKQTGYVGAPFPLLPIPLIIPGSFYGDEKPNIALSLSADYTFENSFYIHTEALYNSNGRTQNAGLYYWDAVQVGMLSPGMWNIFQEFAYDVHPLVRISVFGLINAIDRSNLIAPMATWSVATNWDLFLLAYLTNGEELTEYGGFGNSFYVRVKYSF